MIDDLDIYRIAKLLIAERGEGVKPHEIDNPFQANLYRSCARQDYRDAAVKYIRELGGERALPEAMETWELNHPAEMG